MRLRVTFSKSGPLIYIGNLDLLTMWERAIRRAQLPLKYSQGFHPQPKLQFAAPLPLGFSSRCEVLDVRLNEDVPLDALADRLNAVLPAGVRVIEVELANEAEPPLQSRLDSADYEVTLSQDPGRDEVQRMLDQLLESETLPRERRNRSYDLRPLIQSAALTEAASDGTVCIHMRLAAREGATGRPDEVLEVLGIPREAARIERTALNFRPVAEQSAIAPGVG